MKTGLVKGCTFSVQEKERRPSPACQRFERSCTRKIFRSLPEPRQNVAALSASTHQRRVSHTSWCGKAGICLGLGALALPADEAAVVIGWGIAISLRRVLVPGATVLEAVVPEELVVVGHVAVALAMRPRAIPVCGRHMQAACMKSERDHACRRKKPRTSSCRQHLPGSSLKKLMTDSMHESVQTETTLSQSLPYQWW